MSGEGSKLYYTVVNSFEFYKEISTKIGIDKFKFNDTIKGLVKSLLKYFALDLNVTFNYIPMSFILNFEERNWEGDLANFVQCYN